MTQAQYPHIPITLIKLEFTINLSKMEMGKVTLIYLKKYKV